MLTEFSRLPTHVLLVHAVVVLLPLTAVLLVLCATWPAVRRRTGVVLPALALVSLGLVPLTTHAGEWLERRVPQSPLLNTHTELGDSLLPWAFGLFVVGAVVWLAHRLAASPLSDDAAGRPGGTVLRVALIVVAVVVAAGTVVQTYRVGESGARAAWQGQFSQQAAPRHHDAD